MKIEGTGWAILVGVITAVISAYSAVTVAGVSEKVEKVKADVEHRRVELDRIRFDADQRARRDSILSELVPYLLGSRDSAHDVAAAMLFVLYPNEAEGVLESLSKSVGVDTGETSRPALDSLLVSAKRLSRATGEWAIVLTSTTTLRAAEREQADASEKGFSGTIFRRGNFYGLVIVGLPNRTEAEGTVVAARSAFAADAYVVNLTRWCREQRATEFGIDCVVSP
jgi:hypothetical protein